MTSQENTKTHRVDDTLNNQLNTMSNLEGITLIWCDTNLNVITRKKLRITKQHIRSINNSVIFHKDEQECINTIKSVKDEKILLVTSGSRAYSILSFEEDYVHRTVQAVFIFCHTKTKYESLKFRYPKIIGIFNDAEELKNAIQKEINSIQEHLEVFKFYNKNEQKSMCNLSNQSATFLWLLVFKHLVGRLPKDEKAKIQMISICKNYYHGNKNEMNLINEFDREYTPEQAIRWYTRPSFVYKLVNRALRTEDIDQLYKFRYYIRDLCDQISKTQEKNNLQQPLILYRGVRLSLEEVNRWKENEGKLISTNGFLSTSLSRDVAVNFALIRTEKNIEESVLIEIECNQESASFAVIGKESVFVKEKEVLFDLGATFEVLSVIEGIDERTKRNISIVKVRSTQEGTELARMYIQRNEKILERYSDGLSLWAVLLTGIGQIDKALKFINTHIHSESSNYNIDEYRRLIFPNKYEEYDETIKYWEYKRRECKNNGVESSVCSLVKALAYSKKGQFNRALLELSSWIQPTAVPPEENDILNSSVYMCIGEIYLSLGRYDLALYYLKKADEIGQKCFSADHIFFANVSENIGDVYKERGEPYCAMEYYQTALIMIEKYYPVPRPAIYCVVAEIYYEMDKFDECKKYYQHAKEFAEKREEDKPEHSAIRFTVTGTIYQLEQDYEQALESFSEALNTQIKIHGLNHPLAAQSYYTIGSILECLNRNDEALINYQTALTIQRAVFPDGHRRIARSLFRIGNLYRQKCKLHLAKVNFNEALAMQDKLLSRNHIDTSFTLNHLGKIIFDEGNIDESLKYLWRALKIQKNFSKGAPHSYQILTLVNLGDVYIKQNISSLALKCLEEALLIKQKFFSEQHPQVLELKSKIDKVKQMKLVQ